MAARGRGRGRGGFGRSNPFEHRVPKFEPFILFPEAVNLPNVPDATFSVEEKGLFNRIANLGIFWESSCYYLHEGATKSRKQDAEIEQHSDVKKQKNTRQQPLAYFLKLSPLNFPSELIQGTKRIKHENKKIRWDQESGERKLELFAKLEEKGQSENESKEKKDGSDDEDEEEEEVEEESSSEGDYDQNIDFDDDEDDWNMDVEQNEDCYE